jgi:hypothetical protein
VTVAAMILKMLMTMMMTMVRMMVRMTKLAGVAVVTAMKMQMEVAEVVRNSPLVNLAANMGVGVGVALSETASASNNPSSLQPASEQAE